MLGHADIFWIETPTRGRLAVIKRPRGGDWLADDVGALAREGVSDIVSLLTPAEAHEDGLDREGDCATQLGLTFHSFPIPDYGVPDRLDDALALVERLIARLVASGVVAIHCRKAMGRSPMMAACILVHVGVEPLDAFARIRAARGLDVPDTTDQVAFVNRLKRRLESPATDLFA